MTVNVKYLSKQQIERDALRLVESYFYGFGQPTQIPIPADDILESFLGLSLGFDDLSRRLGAPDTDILGALWVDRREVLIDQSLDPIVHPKMEGRFNFSVGHEIGHWRLHREYVAGAGEQRGIFPNDEHQPTVICRTSQKKAPIEWQADCFSSCLLMPRQFVFDAWFAHFGKMNPFVYADAANLNGERRTRSRGLRPIQEIMGRLAEEELEPHANEFDNIAKQFKSMFGVSTQAMRIRLENLGLLRIEHPIEQDLFGGV